MKNFLFLIMVFLGVQFYTIAQISEPMTFSDVYVNNASDTEDSAALFDLLFINDIGTSGSTNDGSLTGVLFFNNEYWFSRWNMDRIHAVDVNNNLIETFTIPGITGARTFTTDGTNIYIATVEDRIYVVDHASKTVINIIEVTSSAIVRMLTYDETLDNGNGGFWIAGFENSVIASIDMNGNELSLIPFGTHGTRPYDGVIDTISVGGPYLWVHELGIVGNDDYITQIDLATGMQTGVRYDFTMDAPAGSTNIQAGGLFLTKDLDPNGPWVFMGVCQSFPSNLLFAVELNEPTAGIEDETISRFELFPNPASEEIYLSNDNSQEKRVIIFDLLGKEMMDVTTAENKLDVSPLVSGIYIVKVVIGNRTFTRKLVVQ